MSLSSQSVATKEDEAWSMVFRRVPTMNTLNFDTSFMMLVAQYKDAFAG